MAERRYWLFKSEPEVYGLDDLERDGWTFWEGIRNYQARNYLRDDMRVGDGVLFYHSNADPPAIVGVARVVREAYPDATQFDPASDYYDPKATPDAPRWVRVDVEYVARFSRPLTLPELKDDPALAGMLVTKKGQRLSVQPVEPHHWQHVTRLGGDAG